MWSLTLIAMCLFQQPDWQVHAQPQPIKMKTIWVTTLDLPEKNFSKKGANLNSGYGQILTR